MTCTRDTYIADWKSWSDAIKAWRSCGCKVCTDALEELDDQLDIDPQQTTL